MKINFLIADEIRPEMSGKQTVLGLYPDNTIVIDYQNQPSSPSAELPEGIDRLSFHVNISDAEDKKHSFKGQFVEPSGENLGNEIPFGETLFGKNSSRSIIIEAKPFVIKGKGTYYFNFYVDDVLYPFPFSIVDSKSITPSVQVDTSVKEEVK